MLTIFFIILISIITLSFGLFVAYVSGMEQCAYNEIVCIIIGLFGRLPTWVGVFIGVFGSTSLAFYFNIQKQNRDDKKNKLREDVKNINQFLVTLNSCLSGLITIKSSYYNKIKNEGNVSRLLSHLYVISKNFQTQIADPSTIAFLMYKKEAAPRDPSNPVYLSGLVDAFNSLLAIYEERNRLALELHNFIHNNSKVGSTIEGKRGLDYQVIKKFGLIKFENLLFVNERFIQEVDTLIVDLHYASYETPIIANDYIKNNASYEDSYLIFSSIPNEKEKEIISHNISFGMEEIHSQIYELSRKIYSSDINRLFLGNDWGRQKVRLNSVR